MLSKTPSVVRDIMVRDCYRVTGDTSVIQLAERLATYRLSGAPVVDGRDRLIGFISEQEVLSQVLDSIYNDSEPLLVKDVMRKDALAVTPNKSITDLAQEMLGAKPKIYPVVEQDHLVGTVMRRDVLNAVLNMRRGKIASHR